MRNVFLILILLGLLTPTVAYSQFKYEFAFNKDTKVLTCEITNTSSDSLVMVQKRYLEDSRSFIDYHYYNSNNKEIKIVQNRLTPENVKIFPPGMSIKYEYLLLDQKKFYNIGDIHHFSIYGSISYINLNKKDLDYLLFEKAFYWE